MLDYAGLEALAAVVREGSFERAARKLHVTPSAVSQRIKLLEERVGQVLVLRGQPCSGTDAGRRLCLHLEQVALLDAKGFISFIFYLSKLEHGRLKRPPTERIFCGEWEWLINMLYIEVPPTCSLLHSRIIPEKLARCPRLLRRLFITAAAN